MDAHKTCSCSTHNKTSLKCKSTISLPVMQWCVIGRAVQWGQRRRRWRGPRGEASWPPSSLARLALLSRPEESGYLRADKDTFCYSCVPECQRTSRTTNSLLTWLLDPTCCRVGRRSICLVPHPVGCWWVRTRRQSSASGSSLAPSCPLLPFFSLPSLPVSILCGPARPLQNRGTAQTWTWAAE